MSIEMSNIMSNPRKKIILHILSTFRRGLYIKGKQQNLNVIEAKQNLKLHDIAKWFAQCLSKKQCKQREY